MILVTRLNGPTFAVNPDLIERAESRPDTVIILVDGSEYVVTEPVQELIARIRDFRASVIATAHALEVDASAPVARPGAAQLEAGERRRTSTSEGTVVRLQPREH